MRTTTTILLAPLFLAGCAASPQSQTAVAEQTVVCARETPTGSNIPVTRCRNASQREQEKTNADEWIESIRKVPGGPKSGSTMP